MVTKIQHLISLGAQGQSEVDVNNRYKNSGQPECHPSFIPDTSNNVLQASEGNS